VAPAGQFRHIDALPLSHVPAVVRMLVAAEQVMSDGLSELYQELLSGSCDCVDRIVLNAYFGKGHSPGGFRV
jgi:hypothetical protein